ncbi:hypothetical protein [Sphingobacterium endophyticum]|nr:hypothetical protein [Sphingobacterium endophyticum]
MELITVLALSAPKDISFLRFSLIAWMIQWWFSAGILAVEPVRKV